MSAANAAPSGRALPIAPMLGVCDTANVLDVLGDLSDAGADKKRDQIALLAGRILDCSRKIRAALPPAGGEGAPAAACVDPPAPTTASNRIALYEILTRCAAYLTARNAPAPQPAASPPSSVASQPTFYVFATGAVDPAAATVLIRAVVARLDAVQRRAQSGSPGVVVAGRADWTSEDNFAQQCQQDPNTRGAFVIQSSIPETYKFNYFLIVANFTTVSAAVNVLGCGVDDHTPSASPLALYRAEAVSGKAHQDAWTLGIFTSIATLLAAGSSKTTVTTGGGHTTVTKNDSNAPVFTGSVLGYFENQNLNLPAQNASVQLTVAGERFAGAAFARLHELCTRPEILRLAAQADPESLPGSPPPEHRTLLAKAASEYIGDCGTFADFSTAP